MIRSITAMAVKDLVLAMRDWLGLFFIIGFPVLMGVLFGALYSGVGRSGGAKMRIAVADEDRSDISRKFIVALQASDAVEIVSLDRSEALNRVRKGGLVGVIALPEGFGETAGLPWEESPAIEIGVDPSRQAESGMLQGLVMQASGKLMAERFRDAAAMRDLIADAQNEFRQSNEVSPAMRPLLLQMMAALEAFLGRLEEVQEADERDGQGDPPPIGGGFQMARLEMVDVTHKPAPGSSEALVAKIRSRWDVSFPQASIWGVLGCSASFAVSIVRERKQGTLLRLQAAPIPRWYVLMGKAVACFIAVLLVLATMVALGAVLGMRPQRLELLALACFCVAFAFVGISLLMSVIGRSEEAVSGAAWGANTIMAMFGGGMIPLAFMPQFMATLSHVSPAKWAILSLEGAIWRGFSLGEMLLPCAVLIAVGAASLLIGAVRIAQMDG